LVYYSVFIFSVTIFSSSQHLLLARERQVVKGLVARATAKLRQT